MRIRDTLKAVAVAAIFTAATPALAATTFSTNFDSTSFGSGAGFTTLSSYEGWTGGSNGIEVQYNNVAGLAFSGANFVELDTNANSSMSRIIDAGSYILKYWYSDRPNVPASSNGVSVMLGANALLTTPGGAGREGTRWSEKTVSFSVAAPTTLTFAALGTSDSLGGYIDSVSLSAVPEPMTWTMMIVGFGMMGAALRNRRTSAKVTYA
jgi:hypothetical protein